MENKIVIVRFKAACEAEAFTTKLLTANPMAETSPLDEEETDRYFTKALKDRVNYHKHFKNTKKRNTKAEKKLTKKLEKLGTREK